ncbi:MAG: peptidylprolyl isomerase [Acidimicrobiales bacterium]
MKKRLLPLLVILGLAAASCNAASLRSVVHAASPYAASVNGHNISQADLNGELEAMKSNQAYISALEAQTKVTGQGAGTFDSGFVAKVLSRQITYQAIAQAVAGRHLEITPADLTAARSDAITSVQGPQIFNGFPRWYQDLLTRRAAQVTALEAGLIGANISPGAIAEYYQVHKSNFVVTCVRHILVTSQATANQLWGEIVHGANFAQLAQTQSIDSGSASSGGDLGCGLPGRFIPQFETAMNALPVGVVSVPVHTQYGWHLIEVTKRQPEGLSQASAAIRADLLRPSQNAFGSFLQSAIIHAHVYVNPRYGDFVASGPNAGITPPSAPPSGVVPPSLAVTSAGLTPGSGASGSAPGSTSTSSPNSGG